MCLNPPYISLYVDEDTTGLERNLSLYLFAGHSAKITLLFLPDLQPGLNGIRQGRHRVRGYAFITLLLLPGLLMASSWASSRAGSLRYHHWISKE